MNSSSEMEVIFEEIIQDILVDGYCVKDHFIDNEAVTALSNCLTKRMEEGEFKQAGVGKNEENQQNSKIRGDFTHWLKADSENPSERDYLRKINDLRIYFNQTCYLGLLDFECHYALYPIGAFYKRHLDRFRSDDHRQISVVIYPNENWDESDGGELAIYPGGKQILISPIGGRLVCFESGKLEHEVMPALKERRSISGWLRN